MEIYICANGKTSGPYTMQQVEGLVASKFFCYQDLIWQEGDTDWRTLGEVLRGPKLKGAKAPAAPRIENLQTPGASSAPAAAPRNGPPPPPAAPEPPPPPRQTIALPTPRSSPPPAPAPVPNHPPPARRTAAIPPGRNRAADSSKVPAAEAEPATIFTPVQEEDATKFTPTASDATEFSLPVTEDHAQEIDLPAPAPARRRRFQPSDLVVHGKYRILEEIETDGKEATAYRAESVLDGSAYFVKQLVESRSNRTDREKIAELRDTLLSIDNECCLRYCDLDIGDNGVVQVFEYLDGYTDLRLFLQSDPESLRNDLDRLLWQLAHGVNYLHSLGIVHRDLKPGNVMVRPEDLRLKIVDYGTTSLVGDQDGAHTTFAGTPHYAPPESQGRKFQERGVNLKKYDWWGVGRIIQEILCGCTVAELVGQGQFSRGSVGLEAHFEAILREERVDYYGSRAGLVEFTEGLLGIEGMGCYRSILRGLLTTNREERWGFDEIEKWFLNPEDPPDEGYDKVSETMASRFFQYQGRAYTLEEIARTLATAEHWDNAQKFLFQGANATRNEKSLVDFIRLDLGDKLLVRDLDEITSLPNPRKMVFRELLPALDEFAIGLALSRISQSGSAPFGLYIRGVQLDRLTLLQWSRSKKLEELHRVAVITHPALFDALDRFAPDLHTAFTPILITLGRIQDLEVLVSKQEFKPTQQARVISLLLASPEEIQGLLAKVQAQFFETSIARLKPLLRGKEIDPDADSIIYLLFCALDQPKRFLTHAEYATKEIAEIQRKTETLFEIYVLLTLSLQLEERRLFLGPLLAQLLTHGFLFLILFCIVVESLLFQLNGVAYKVVNDSMTFLAISFVVSYLIVFSTLRFCVWTFLKRFVEAHIPTIWINPDITQDALGERATKAGWDGKARAEVKRDYQAAIEHYHTLPKTNQPARTFPTLPEPKGIDPFYWLTAILIVYSSFVPGLVVLFSNTESIRPDPDYDPTVMAFFHALSLVWITFTPLVFLIPALGLAATTLSKLPIRPEPVAVKQSKGGRPPPPHPNKPKVI